MTLDVYFNHQSDTKHGSSAEKRELSNLLRRLNLFEEIPNPEKFRNFAGVERKIGNFQYLDTDDPATGLSGVSEADRKTWEKYHDNPELIHKLACAIRKSVSDGSIMRTDVDIAEENAFPEGRLLYRMHCQRERNSQVVELAKAEAAMAGALHCTICGFDFEETYGEIGSGYIEAHHVKPISEYQIGDVTRVEDLVLLCSNCHRMIHRRRPWLLPSDLRKLIVS